MLLLQGQGTYPGKQAGRCPKIKEPATGVEKGIQKLAPLRKLSYCGPGHKEMESLSEVGHVRKQDVSLLLPDCFCKILQQIWRLILGLIAWIKQDLKQNKAGLFQCFLPLLHPISLYTTLSLAFSVGLSYVTFQTCHIG